MYTMQLKVSSWDFVRFFLFYIWETDLHINKDQFKF